MDKIQSHFFFCTAPPHRHRSCESAHWCDFHGPEKLPQTRILPWQRHKDVYTHRGSRPASVSQPAAELTCLHQTRCQAASCRTDVLLRVCLWSLTGAECPRGLPTADYNSCFWPVVVSSVLYKRQNSCQLFYLCHYRSLLRQNPGRLQQMLCERWPNDHKT